VWLDPGLIDQDAHLAVGHAVEVIGKVDQNLHIKVQAATDFGTNIGMLCQEWNV
jgi:replication factor A3